MSSQDFKDWESAPQIDPLILRLLQKKYEKSDVPQVDNSVKQRSLGILYAAFLGVGSFILVIVCGTIYCTDVDIILANGCRAIFLYGIIGFVIGTIAEMCLNESAKSMIRKMLQRTDQLENAAANDATNDN